MKTSKPFSTISYNTEAFLVSKLDAYIARRCISFYAFIKHYRESDETKDHIHLIIIPNGQIQTDSLTDELQELNPADPLKPFGIMPWRSSKWDDWYLYACHDSAYLASKGQTRGHHYQESDFVSSNKDYLHELVTTIDRTKYAKTQDFVEKVAKGTSLYDLLLSGQIPAPQFNQWHQMYNYLLQERVFRNGAVSHSPADTVSCNPATGEVDEDLDI